MKARILALIFALALCTPVLADEIGSGRCGKPGDICFDGFQAATNAAGDAGDDEIGSGKTRAPDSEATEFSFESFWMFWKSSFWQEF